MTHAVFHYINDPLCGWCYGASPLVSVINETEGVTLKLHCGGLWTGNHRTNMGPALQSHVLPHDDRIEAMTGQVFGEAYRNGLLLNTNYILDSEPPIRAIIAAKSMGGSDFEMYKKVQAAHYQRGLYVGDLQVLTRLAQELGLEQDAFVNAYHTAGFSNHIEQSQQWMNRLGGRGYPTAGLEIGSQLHAVPLSSFYGQVEQFRTVLKDFMSASK
ncbi:DSBA-like thioredoxin domain protein [Vibrio aerogenes CECT 7868]|uniref:DSBA-like thioredoxin domain protein n=1 Tax=Vibrio aerogenes CECT 7868 TaxID=1216006 RepID=A0A1M5UR28_9VIBR|nr:DsbA family protein [Vibrio aerogenes]SHH65439.1 DSBA-like thioredoxin domain protein [Vibrio aerogenes CECT 7868]